MSKGPQTDMNKYQEEVTLQYLCANIFAPYCQYLFAFWVMTVMYLKGTLESICYETFFLFRIWLSCMTIGDYNHYSFFLNSI